MLEVSVQKRFDSFDLSATFSAGDGITVIFGPSGSGKSLTLQMIAGIFTPDKGSIAIDGEPLFDSERKINRPPQHRRIGYVPQNYALFPHLTVTQNIAFGLSGGRAQKKERVADMIATMKLQGFENRRPGQISGGQQQRVALARALAFQPRLLLLDEPFSSLDTMIRLSLRQELLELIERRPTTTLLVTHDMAEAYTVGSRIVIFDDGKVLQQGDRDEVFYHPNSRRVAELVGTRNILPATVVSRESDALCVNWRGYLFYADLQDIPIGRQVSLCIRPTQVMIARPDRPSSSPPENRVAVRIVREAINGENYILYLRTEASAEPYDLEVELPGYVYYRLGLDANKEITVSLRRSALHLIPP